MGGGALGCAEAARSLISPLILWWSLIGIPSYQVHQRTMGDGLGVCFGLQVPYSFVLIFVVIFDRDILGISENHGGVALGCAGAAGSLISRVIFDPTAGPACINRMLSVSQSYVQVSQSCAQCVSIVCSSCLNRVFGVSQSYVKRVSIVCSLFQGGGAAVSKGC